MAIGPSKTALAMPMQCLGGGQQEVHPPQGPHQQHRADSHHGQVERPAVGAPQVGDGIGGYQHHLAQGDAERRLLAIVRELNAEGAAGFNEEVQELRRGSLVELLPQWVPRSGIIHAVFASRRGLLPSVRTLIDYLAVRFRQLDE